MWGSETATAVEERWQDAWESRGSFDTPPASCVLAISAPPKEGIDLTSLRSYVTADAQARFRRSQGEAVRFSVVFDPVDRQAGGEPEGDERAFAAARTTLKRLGCSCGSKQIMDLPEPARSHGTQALFLSLLKQDLVYEAQGRWFLRAAPFLEANQKGLEELSGWSESALASQQEVAGGGVSGWEVDASILGIGQLPVFTPHLDQISEAAFIALSPFFPGADSFVSEPADASQLERLREQSDLPPLETGLQASVPGVDDLLPVVIWAAVEDRYGPTAVLGIPSSDAEDGEVAKNLRPTALGGLKMKSSSSGKPRETERYRQSNILLSQEGGGGAALPIVHCDKCGSRPLPDPEATADQCPECGGPARRVPGTIDPRLTAMWTWLSACTPSGDLGVPSPWNGDSEWRPPTTHVVASPDAAELLFEQRLGAKVLQGLAVLDRDAREPFQRAFVPENVKVQTGESDEGIADPASLLDQLGADVLRFAVLNAAAPRTSFRWTQTPVRRSERFLEDLWAYAEPRLREWSTAEEAHVDPSTRLRRRLSVWLRVAADKITTSLEDLETQRATHDLVLLLARIQDFERRAANGGELDQADRDAVVHSLLVLVRLLSTCAPHISEELWRVAGNSSTVEDAPWPDISELHPKHASVAQLATAQ